MKNTSEKIPNAEKISKALRPLYADATSDVTQRRTLDTAERSLSYLEEGQVSIQDFPFFVFSATHALHGGVPQDDDEKKNVVSHAPTSALH